jgi:hypothetical protein
MVLNVVPTHKGHFATKTEGRTVGKRIIRNKAEEGRNRKENWSRGRQMHTCF